MTAKYGNKKKLKFYLYRSLDYYSYISKVQEQIRKADRFRQLKFSCARVRNKIDQSVRSNFQAAKPWRSPKRGCLQGVQGPTIWAKFPRIIV